MRSINHWWLICRTQQNQHKGVLSLTPLALGQAALRLLQSPHALVLQHFALRQLLSNARLALRGLQEGAQAERFFRP
jgi:hypothetical protein